MKYKKKTEVKLKLKITLKKGKQENVENLYKIKEKMKTKKILFEM